MLIPSEIKRSFSRLSPKEEWSFASIGRSETNYITHGYHRYPAKFIPQIVKKLINDHTSPEDLVCDPFGGCGTTLVEAKISGRRSIGFDINPIAKFITQTKVTPISLKTLRKCEKKLLFACKNAPDISTEHHPRVNYWFEDRTIKELDKIYCAIKETKNCTVRRFFLCAFSHILKNCSRWLMKSIKPTIDKDKIIPNPIDIFTRHINLMIKKNEEFYNNLVGSNNLQTPTKMRRWDSSKKLPIDSKSIDLIITSPPYVTSYEYVDLHQLSLLWFSSDNELFKKWSCCDNDLQLFRKKFIGTRFKKTKYGKHQSIIAGQIIDKLASRKKGLAKNVENYFIDMQKVFQEMHRVLKKGRKACIIIGNTMLRGVKILNAQVAVEQMQNIGFEKLDFIKREVLNKMIAPWRDSNNGRFTGLKNLNKKRAYEHEYIIVMQK